MSQIQTIKNITVNQNLTISHDWNIKTNIVMQPDEMIIRTISYVSNSQDAPGVYSIWCDLIHDFIGSFAISINTSIATNFIARNLSPQTRILLSNHNISNNPTINFKIYGFNANNDFVPITNLTGITGDLSMTLEFVTYKKK